MESLRPGDPRRVGEYELLARLGKGGMAVVYLGRSRGGRAVAVKVIRKRYVDNPEYRARLRRELRSARMVAGAFTAPVLDADPEATPPWLVTAYLPGLSLGEALGGFGGLPLPAVRMLAAGLAEALADIHRTGLVHRDLTPANVVLTADGPRVIDFGIARPEDAAPITRIGDRIGTPPFMSPEQFAGATVGPSTDVYALGAVLVYAATGQIPAHQGDGSGPGSGAIEDRELSRLVGRCLRGRPDQRPSAVELLHRLGATPNSALPAPLAAEIDRRIARSRELFVHPVGEPPSWPEHRRMAEVTANPALVLADPEQPTSGWSRRRVITAGAAVLALTGGVVELLGGHAANRQSTPSAAVTSRAPPRKQIDEQPPAPPVATLRWRAKVSAYYPELYAAGGVVVAKVAEDAMVALDPATGRELWRRDANRSSRVLGDTAYAVAPTGLPTVSAVEPASGAARWTYQAPLGQFFVLMATAGPVLCYGDERIRALAVADGGVRWTAATAELRGMHGDGEILLARTDKALAALDPSSGETRWTYAVNKPLSSTVAGNTVIVTDLSKALHAVRADNGTLVWQRSDLPDLLGIRSGDRLLYADDSGRGVLALNPATGDQVWYRHLVPREAAVPSGRNTFGWSKGTLYVATRHQKVYALDGATGQIRWSYDVEATNGPGPVELGGLVFTGTRTGDVFALAPPEGVARAGD